MENSKTSAESLIRSVIENEKKTINKIYSLFYTPTKIDLLENKIIRTPRGGKDSYNSLQFTKEGFYELFNDNSKEFKNKLETATSGFEKVNNRILTLHSSALIPFLTFYKVSIDNPITIPLPVNEDGNTLNVTFRNSIFEFGNKIVDSSHDSKIDIALFDGMNIEDSNNILLLESKFTEYFNNCGKVDKISEKYYDIFNITPIKEYLNQLDLILKNDINHENHFILDKSEGRNLIFCEGIKQMVCHYLGAMHYASTHKNQHIYLGTILFDFGREVKNANSKLKSYKTMYQDLANVLTGLIYYSDEKYQRPSNLTILKDIITYKDIYSLEFPFNENAKIIYADK